MRRLIGKASDAGRDWGQEEKGMTEDEMVGWHHLLMDMSLSKLWELVMDRETWHSAIQAVAKGRIWLNHWTENLVQHVLLPPAISMLVTFPVTFTLTEICMKLSVWVWAFGPRVKSSSETTYPAALFPIHHKLSSWWLTSNVQNKVRIPRAGALFLFCCNVSSY